jgi:hypothetical protein
MAKENAQSYTYAVVKHQVPEKKAYEIQRSHSGALVASLVHIVPVAVTFSILQLSFRHYYWGDADAANQRVKLSGLQVAAKIHEILILVSLSSMVLHYTRKLMVSPGGISFGLLEAAYQSGLSSNPWTIGNWQALKHLKDRVRTKEPPSKANDTKNLPAWHLVALLFIFAFLALFVGPASAITLLPQLGWWHRGDLIGLMHKDGNVQAVSSVYIPTNLFPLQVDKSVIPAFCNDAAKDTNGICPSAQLDLIERSFTVPPDFYSEPKIQNITISQGEDDPILRRMISRQFFSRAATTVPNYLLASYASLLKLASYQPDGSFTLELIAKDTVPLDPLVGVICNDTTADVFVRDFHYEMDDFDWTGPGKGSWEFEKLANIDIRSIWSEEQLQTAVNGTELVWKDMTDTTTDPVMLALMRHERNVTVCTVQSYWTPTSQWVLSTSNYDVATNFSFDPSTGAKTWSMYAYPYYLNAHKIHLHEDWVDTLNAVNGSTRTLDTLLQHGIKTIKDATSNTSSNSAVAPFDSSYQFLEATISQLLAKSIANALSRIGVEYAADHFRSATSLKEIMHCNEKTRWCSQGPWYTRLTMPHAVIINSTYEAAYSYDRAENPFGLSSDSPILRSFPKPADADKIWTRISFPIHKYGYAYAFEGVTTYLAVALLCFHAAIVLVHIVYRVALDCQMFDFGESLGNLLILALGDRAPSGGNLWSKRVAVVPFGSVIDSKKFRLEVMETKSVDVDKEMARHVGSEEEILTGSTMWFEARESRYPSAGLQGHAAP